MKSFMAACKASVGLFIYNKLRQVKKSLFLLFAFLVAVAPSMAQTVTGRVTDAHTGEPIPFANVHYDGSAGVQTDTAGYYAIAQRKGTLVFSYIGYETQRIPINKATIVDVRLFSKSKELKEAVVSGRRGKYSRKNNPAVELMRNVIAAKKKSDLTQHDYYSYNRYQKLTFALNDVTEKVFQDGSFKRLPFLREHVERDPETGKFILPVSVDETVSRQIYRKEPKSEKEIILGRRSNGVNELFSTGDIMTTMLQDCFTDVNIYEDNVRLLQYPFVSPISTRSAIRFYRYFIEDTVMVDSDKCIEVSFTPNNPQDFGFSGSLFIMADSSYRVKSVEMGVPHRSDVNFVERMTISQKFTQLPTGEQVLVDDDMTVQLKIVDFIQKFQVRRTTEYSGYSFAAIGDREFNFKGSQRTDANAMMRDEAFWEEHRSESLTKSESSMDLFIRRLENVKGFKPVLFIAKAFIENFVETSVDTERPSKVDIGPINTMISQNFVDGLRLRASAQTTANLNPHWFMKGYVAYGFKDERWKGSGEVTYSFNKKAYLPREFPVSNLTFTYTRDVMSPSDKFMPTDKDNVFTSFKWTRVDHMMYYERFRLLYDQEWSNGLRFGLEFKREENEPTAALFYQPLDAEGTPSPDHSRYVRSIKTTDARISLEYQPGATWINTKQRRIKANHDTPVFTLSHTVGVRGVLGSDYDYNFTEASVYKRFWLASWGKIDATVKGGIQWNRVPYPLLIMPAANLSYIVEDNTFSLIDNMEFLNDRYVSAMVSWDMNGKILNRIPLIRKLKWREYFACNVLWGTLTSKNDPWKNPGDSRLFYFPGRFNANGEYEYLSTVMDRKTPYVEVVAGIHNIFKVFHVEYVRRLTYLDRPGTDKWGIRFMFRVTF